MFCLLCALAISPNLDIDIPAMQATLAFEKLSAAVGQHWEVSRELAREIVVIKADEVSRDELKARLARVMGGEWERTTDGEKLVRPQRLSDAWRTAALRERTTSVATLIGEKFKSLPAWNAGTANQVVTGIAKAAEAAANAGPTKSSEARGALADSSGTAPCGRALITLLHDLPPQTIASLGADDQIVFSDPPTKKESALPASAEAVLNQLNVEQKAFNQIALERKDLYPAVDYLDPRFNLTPEDQPATRLVLILRRFAAGYMIASLQAADQSGTVIARASENLIVARPALEQEKSKSGGELAYSDRALSWDQLYMRRSGRYGGSEKMDEAPLVAKWQESLSDEILHEPMAYSVDEEIRFVASDLKLNLIADLPDELLSSIPSMPAGGKASAADVMRRLQGAFRNCSLRVQDGWLEAEPVDRLKASHDRLDRTLLSELAKEVYKNQGINLDTLASYAFRQQSNLTFESLDQLIPRMFAKPEEEGASDQASVNSRVLLRLWGSLTSPERATLRQGGKFQLIDLPPASRKLVDDLVYDLRGSFAFTLQSPFSVDPASTMRRSIRAVPHEGLPNGLDAGTTLKGEPFVTTQLCFTTDREEVKAGSAASIAWDLATNKLAPDGVRYRMAKREEIRLNFDFGNSFTAHADLHEDPSAWSAEVPYSELPQDIRATLETEFAKQSARIAAEEEKARKQTIPPSALR